MIVSISIEDKGWSSISDLEALATRAVNAVADAEFGDSELREVTLLFTSDAEIEAMNTRWRDQKKPTNVLSFPSPKGHSVPPGEPEFLGDIVLAAGVVAREAREQGKSVEERASHLIVHGMLHLLGYGHERDPDAERMEKREAAILATLGFPDPYAADKVL
jgi:probable rRNA maturation factor